MALALTPNSAPARPSPSGHITLVVLKWMRRVAAIVLAAFWSIFFVEHISEWYSHPDRGFPPAWVTGMMVAHLALIIGLLLMLRWERLGAVVTTLGTVAFLGIFAIARHTMHLPYIMLYTLIPVGIVAAELILARLTSPRSAS